MTLTLEQEVRIRARCDEHVQYWEGPWRFDRGEAERDLEFHRQEEHTPPEPISEEKIIEWLDFIADKSDYGPDEVHVSRAEMRQIITEIEVGRWAAAVADFVLGVEVESDIITIAKPSPALAAWHEYRRMYPASNQREQGAQDG